VARQNSTLRFLARLIFDPGDGADIFLRKISSYTDCTALYPRRWQHSWLPLWELQILHNQLLMSVALSAEGKATALVGYQIGYRPDLLKLEKKTPVPNWHLAWSPAIGEGCKGCKDEWAGCLNPKETIPCRTMEVTEILTKEISNCMELSTTREATSC
jgi:hypothetical protein